MSSALPDTLACRELIEELARRLGRHPAVERVWLFGSRARGDNFERSDIDLAVEAPGMGRYETATSHPTAIRSLSPWRSTAALGPTLGLVLAFSP